MQTQGHYENGDIENIWRLYDDNCWIAFEYDENPGLHTGMNLEIKGMVNGTINMYGRDYVLIKDVTIL